MRVHVAAGASVLWLLAACTAGSQPEGMPDVDFPLERLNKQIRLCAPAGLNTFKANSGIRLLVEVTGPETIIFPPDFGIRPFLYRKGGWVELSQVPTTYAHGDVILAPSGGDPLLTGIAHTFPILPEGEEAALLRIFVFGHVYRDGAATDEAVGAYIDVILTP